MAQVNMNVDTQKAKECANNIISLADEYIDTVNSLFSKLQKVKDTGAWVGRSAEVFIQNAKIAEKEYVRLGKQLKKYGKAVKATANSIDLNIAKNTI